MPLPPRDLHKTEVFLNSLNDSMIITAERDVDRVKIIISNENDDTVYATNISVVTAKKLGEALRQAADFTYPF